MKNIEKVLLITLFFCMYIRFISGFPLDNSSLPGGVDTPAHLYRIWYTSTKGLSNWSYYWNGGVPFQRFYPPFLPWLGGILGKIFGFLLAYKLLNNLFFVLSPLVFFYFLKEFNLPTEKILIAILFFSLIPIYSYFQADGRWSSIINLVFCLIYWIFLKRAVDGDKKYIILSGVALSFCVLTHLITTVFLILITLIWVFFYRMKFDVFYKLFVIFASAFILTSFWSVQFLTYTWRLSKSTSYSYAGVLKTSRISNIPQELLTRVITSVELYSKNNLSTILLMVAIFVFSFLSLFRLKDKITREFIIVGIIIGLMVLFVRFKRSFIFLPIPLSVLVVEGIYLFGKKTRVVLSSMLFILLLISFFSIRSQSYPYPEYPKIPRDGRVIFLPFGLGFPNLYKYSIVLAPLNGNENIFEWGWITQEINYIVAYSTEKNVYNDLLVRPENVTKEDYYNLLKDGYVNYIVVNKNYNNLVNYFNLSEFVHVIDETKMHIVFELSPKSTYVEINETPTIASVNKKVDEILIQTNCTSGELIIKETYDNFWKGEINDKAIELERTNHSFIKTEMNEGGPCVIKLKFEVPNYYFLFNLISIIGYIVVIIYLIFSFSTLLSKKKKRRT